MSWPAGRWRSGAVTGDADLRGLALCLYGGTLVHQGRAVEGLALLDEMLAVVSAEISPMAAGAVCCTVISICREIAELRRAHGVDRGAGRLVQQAAGDGGLHRAVSCPSRRAHAAARRMAASARNVIWCTGFHPGFSWLDLPVLDGEDPGTSAGSCVANRVCTSSGRTSPTRCRRR